MHEITGRRLSNTVYVRYCFRSALRCCINCIVRRLVPTFSWCGRNVSGTTWSCISPGSAATDVSAADVGLDVDRVHHCVPPTRQHHPPLQQPQPYRQFLFYTLCSVGEGRNWKRKIETKKKKKGRKLRKRDGKLIEKEKRRKEKKGTERGGNRKFLFYIFKKRKEVREVKGKKEREYRKFLKGKGMNKKKETRKKGGKEMRGNRKFLFYMSGKQTKKRKRKKEREE